MDIQVINNLPGVFVDITKGRGVITVTLSEREKRALSSYTPGSVVKLGEREFIVLEQSGDTTAVIAKEFVRKMGFGRSNKWCDSEVRRYLNRDFYNELSAAVGKDNIIEHTVDLEAEDGTNKGVTTKDNISVLTAGLYRRYREFLPAYGDWWWTATPASAHVDYARYVCYVNSGGFLNWFGCGYVGGVRPFCILNSSLLVSE